VRSFRASGAEYLPATTVWAAARRAEGFDLGISGGRPGTRIGGTFAARALLVASGAIERPLPFPGWTLPGVLTAGAVQGLLKSSALAPSGRVVLAGSGPLLWQVAWQLTNAGVAIDRVLETIPRGRLAEAMRHAPGFMFSTYLARGLELVRTVRRRTSVVEHVAELQARGDGRVEACANAVDGEWAEIRPTSSSSRTAWFRMSTCRRRWAASSSGTRTSRRSSRADAWGGTSADGVYVAGDVAGIAGARGAEARAGSLRWPSPTHSAASTVARRDALAAPAQQALATTLRGRRFLDVLYRPAPRSCVRAVRPLVCRCEEVTADTVRDAVRDGAATLHAPERPRAAAWDPVRPLLSRHRDRDPG